MDFSAGDLKRVQGLIRLPLCTRGATPQVVRSSGGFAEVEAREHDLAIALWGLGACGPEIEINACAWLLY